MIQPKSRLLVTNRTIYKSSDRSVTKKKGLISRNSLKTLFVYVWSRESGKLFLGFRTNSDGLGEASSHHADKRVKGQRLFWIFVKVHRVPLPPLVRLSVFHWKLFSSFLGSTQWVLFNHSGQLKLFSQTLFLLLHAWWLRVDREKRLQGWFSLSDLLAQIFFCQSNPAFISSLLQVSSSCNCTYTLYVVQSLTVATRRPLNELRFALNQNNQKAYNYWLKFR